jgi:hypothetical protein
MAMTSQTSSDTGDILGLATETVSRAIANLKREGHIWPLQDSKVELSDLEAPRELSESW